MSENWRSTVLHLRFPFSYFLLPIFLAAMAAVPVLPARALAVFAIFHLLVYPASNGFNSYYDRDEGPIGGLASPPRVHRSLLAAALALDAVALVWAFLVDPLLGAAVFCYGLCSKLYSWDRTRIKRFPLTGWLWTGLGQGTLTFIAMAAALSGRGLADLDAGVYRGSALIALFLLGVYPLTQVYQHEEDRRRGDLTLSRLLGIRGTFLAAALFLGAAAAGLAFWVHARGGLFWTAAFLALQLPALAYFGAWTLRVLRGSGAADYRSTMRMNLIASTFLSLFFGLFIFLD